MIVGYLFEGLPGTSQSEVRVDSVSQRSARQIALQVIGLNGQFLAGPSLLDGRVAWYRSCAVQEASCRTFAGPWRMRLSAGSYERGAAGPTPVPGFADTGSRLYEVACSLGETIVGPPPDGLPGHVDRAARIHRRAAAGPRSVAAAVGVGNSRSVRQFAAHQG